MYCGNKNDEDKDFCYSCGARLPDTINKEKIRLLSQTIKYGMSGSMINPFGKWNPEEDEND